MVHPDHQYDPSNIPQAVLPIIYNEADAVFGSRMMIPRQARKGGMPLWKYAANIFLTKLANFILRAKLTEYHSGFRAYSKKALEVLPFERNSNNFIFDTEIIIQLLNYCELRNTQLPFCHPEFISGSMQNNGDSETSSE